MTALPLPGVIAGPLNRALGDLMSPRGLAFDFLAPAGEAALVAHDSVSWRIFRNPVSVFIGGVAAVILELAEPRVRSGVWDFTSFRRDPVTRMRRTGLAAMATVYGARSQAEALIGGVVRAHGRITGVTPGGEPYRADDPELLDWVQATASYGFIEAYHRYVRPLPPQVRDAAYAESQGPARLYGARGAPISHAAWIQTAERMRPRLERSPIVFAYLDIVRRAPALPGPLQPMQRMLVRAAVDLQPVWLRDLLGLDGRMGLRPGEAMLLRQIAGLADRVVLDAHPAELACRRVGLPRGYLARSWDRRGPALAGSPHLH